MSFREFPFLVQHFLENSAQRLPDKVALICGEDRLTYGQLDHQAGRLAQRLLGLGVRRQDRVAILLDNSVESVVALFGILKAGAIFVMLSAGIKPKKLNYILRDSGARSLITHSGKAGVVLESITDAPNLENIIWVGSIPKLPNAGSTAVRHKNWTDLLSTSYELSALSSGAIDLDLAAIIYTSGSTGEPKGVMSAHCSMVAAARSIIQYIGNVADDIIMNVLPLSFDYGLYQVLMAFLFGGTVVLEKSFLFPVRILEKIVQERVTGFPLVPTMAALLLQMENLAKFDFSALRYMTNTAAALPVAYIRKLQSLFPHVTLFSMYGLTECKRVSYLPPEQLNQRPDSVGIPIPNEEVFVVDENGNELPPGQVGELVVRGSNVMQGYWNAPEETAKKFRPGPCRRETLLYSGDLFKRDAEGYLYFVGRKDDMIKTKGERVSPKEIENALCEMKGVVEAAVIGVPDEVFGQAIKAFIVRNSGGVIGEKEVLKHCSKTIEAFMVPKFVEFRESLPRNASGKVDKKKLIAHSSQLRDDCSGMRGERGKYCK
jgi:amino acid adenylation domain-containing protein